MGVGHMGFSLEEAHQVFLGWLLLLCSVCSKVFLFI